MKYTYKSMQTKILCILDGFGLAPESPSNAFSKNNCPFIHSLFKNYPWLMLDADGDSVGQETGLVGNSEVGHMNLGGLQLVNQLSYEITQSAKHSFEHKTLNRIFDPTTLLSKTSNHTVHLIGLFSNGTIHSDLRHWLACLTSCHKANKKNIVLHLISDGRDTDRKSVQQIWQNFVSQNSRQLKSMQHKISLGSVGGRFYGMDRDNNMERTKKALEVIYEDSKSETRFAEIDSFLNRVASESYSKNIYDEHIIPVSSGYGIKKYDSIWLVNFRSDRMRQITNKLIENSKNNDLCNVIIANNSYNIDKEIIYTKDIFNDTTRVLEGYLPIFMRKNVPNTFSDRCYKHNKTVLHIAETEKYAHVTHFFTGGRKEPRPNEHFKLIPSNQIESHAQKPHMKAKEITDYIIDKGIGRYDYIVVNYANPDMVGHTGNINAAIETMNFLDFQLKKLWDHLKQNSGKMILTADHGNVERVGAVDGEGFDTEHNANPVPCIFLSQDTDFLNMNERYKTVIGSNSVADSIDLKEKILKANQNKLSFSSDFTAFKGELPLWYAGLFTLLL